MIDYGPGDSVVCVNADENFNSEMGGNYWTAPVEGAVYVVLDVLPLAVRGGKLSVLLAGHPNLDMWSGEDGGYDPRRFRKLQKTKTDMWTWAHQPTDYEQPKAPKREKAL